MVIPASAAATTISDSTVIAFPSLLSIRIAGVRASATAVQWTFVLASTAASKLSQIANRTALPGADVVPSALERGRVIERQLLAVRPRHRRRVR